MTLKNNKQEKPFKVFLLGGTKDSTNIIKFIKKNYENSYILTTTTTEYGSKLAKESGSDKTIAKPLLKNEILKILNNEKFDILIDATHPFASHIRQTGIEISEMIKIEYIRYERCMFDFNNIEYDKIHHVNSFEDAGKLIADEFNQKNVLHFAGFKTIQDIVKYINVKNFYPRIIKVPTAMKKCKELGIKPDQIIEMNGVATKKENINLIKKHEAVAIVTKESGEIGGLIEKIEAAKECGIAIIIVDRPIIKKLNNKTSINELESLKKEIDKIEVHKNKTKK